MHLHNGISHLAAACVRRTAADVGGSRSGCRGKSASAAGILRSAVKNEGLFVLSVAAGVSTSQKKKKKRPKSENCSQELL